MSGDHVLAAVRRMVPDALVWSLRCKGTAVASRAHAGSDSLVAVLALGSHAKGKVYTDRFDRISTLRTSPRAGPQRPP